MYPETTQQHSPAPVRRSISTTRDYKATIRDEDMLLVLSQNWAAIDQALMQIQRSTIALMDEDGEQLKTKLVGVTKVMSDLLVMKEKGDKIIEDAKNGKR